MPSEKCIPVLEKMNAQEKKEICDKKSIRSLVGCVATKKRKIDGMEFGPAMKAAWAEVKGYCKDSR